MLHRLRQPGRLLIAVSGGSDSTGLLVVLHQILAAHAAEFPDISLCAVTVDHALRAESTAEALRVAELCHSLSIPHEIVRWEGEKPRTGVSAAAREARYGLLVEAATRLGATAILTGHTLDDQRETIAMRAERGGDEAAGLSGMAPSVLLHGRHYLLRPFLHTTRQAIREELVAAGIGWIDDPSNEDRRYERVRVRGLLADSESVSFAEIQRAQAERQALSDRAADLLSRHLTIRHAVLGHLARPALDAEWSVLRHALRSLAAVLGGRDHLPPVEAVERLQALTGSGEAFRTTMGRVLFHANSGGLYILRERRGLSVIMVAPGETTVWDGRFRVANFSERPVRIGPCDDPLSDVEEPLSCPPSLAQLAALVRPRAVYAEPWSEEKIRIQPILAPFGRFLPQFESNLAKVIAEKLGLPPLPLGPFNALERKT
ncbi:tRNA lysidine(34) synthetase TilS [Rhizobium oryzicola]|uniref:tRNA(Ile)-lysidine synthase n=1 Tax=Rhizobium oryzicola TaxID=1232668 RepID=A0ABT8SVI4_9HYPH|nr:tRNA lysidine(34) synthetase TilS [Rhizobium oryzicola]MDO1582063.1 tRNA lysidine(34) synthetase TilS [Rhizobium oryzicola]